MTESRYAQSIAADAQRWSQLRMWPNQYRQILALAYMSSKQGSIAQPHLDALRETLTFSLVPKDEVARRLFAAGQYASFLRSDKSVHENNEPANTALYRAAAYAMDRESLPRAYQALQSIDKASVDPQKLAALQASLDQRRWGKFPWVFDRDGKPIATLVWSAAAMPSLSANRDFDAHRPQRRPTHSRRTTRSSRRLR